METVVHPVGLLAANCYILRTENEAMVIDPGGDTEIIVSEIGPRNLARILFTHGHYDHIAAGNELKERFSAPIAVHEADAGMITNPILNLSEMVGEPYVSAGPDIILHGGDIFRFAETQFKIIHTPGHTMGSVCILTGDELFAGDTLFFRSVGRTDLPTGSIDELRSSIITKLYTLPDTVRVYTGHGDDTLIGEEKKHNEFVRA